MSTPMPANAHDIYRRYVGAIELHGLAITNAIGLTASDLYAMNTLLLAGPLTAGELAKRIGLTTGATTRLIDRLERSGLLARSPHPSDRRKITLEPIPTPEVDRAVNPARSKLEKLLSGYDADRLATLFDYFTRAADIYEQAVEELREP